MPDNTLLPADAGDAERPRKSLSILVVDDSKTARFAMRKYLESLSCHVDTVDNAYEAYSFLTDHHPDVIFLDNVMPGINGIDVLSTLQNDRTTAFIPVIFCTSIENEDFIIKALKSGAREVLHKPPTVDVLSELLANLNHNERLQTAANCDVAPPATAAPEPMAVTKGPPEEDVAQATYRHLQTQIDQALQRLKNELSVQVSELSSQIAAFETAGISEEEIAVFRQIAREEAEALSQSLHSEMTAIHRRLDRIALRQFRSMRSALDHQQN